MSRDLSRQRSLEELAAAVRSGRRELDDLLKAARPLVCRWALIHTGDPDMAEDVAQVALVRVHRSFTGFQGGSRFATWLYRLVANVARDETRKTRRHQRNQEAVTSRLSMRNSLSAPGPDRIEEVLRVLLEGLSPRQRAAFELVDLQGFSGPEAAAMEGVKESTLRVHLARARSTVRRAIEEMAT